MFTGKRATSELETPACGIHESTEGPSRFSWQGIDKLLTDFERKDDLIKPPKSIEHQYMWCLKYWLRDIEKAGNKDMEWLILPLKKDGSPWHERFMDRYNENINLCELSDLFVTQTMKPRMKCTRLLLPRLRGALSQPPCLSSLSAESRQGILV